MIHNILMMPYGIYGRFYKHLGRYDFLDIMEQENEEIPLYEQKKVQEVKGSYYIYLPKKWCNKYVETKKRVYLQQLSDDSLLIRPSINGELIQAEYFIDLDEPNKHPLDVDKSEYLDYLFNQFLTAYLIGFYRIRIKKRDISLKLRKKFMEMTRTFYGMEIVSEIENEIIIEDVGSSLDIRQLMRQILSRVEILMETYINIARKEEYEDLDEIIEQDSQIDQHRYAIERQVHRILEFPSLGHTAKLTAIECLHLGQVAKIVERIGDYITKLSKQLKEQKITNKDEVLYHLQNMHQVFHTIQDYFEREDSLQYFHLIKMVAGFSDTTKEILLKGHPDANFLSYIRRVKNMCADIAEIRINDILYRKRFRNDVI